MTQRPSPPAADNDAAFVPAANLTRRVRQARRVSRPRQIERVPAPQLLDPAERERQRALTARRAQRRADVASNDGLTRCSGCGRHVTVSDYDAGGCRFCGTSSSRGQLKVRRSGRPRINPDDLPAPMRVLTQALASSSVTRPPKSGPTNDHFNGDLSEVVRVPTPQEAASPHPTLAVWELTLACDLRCRHCGSRAAAPRTRELSTPEALEVVHQLKDVGIRELSLIGGEAYLYPGWLEVIREASKLGMVVGIQTGARQLTQERLDQAIDAGLALVGISIDGLRQTHDAQRGRKGSWSAALEAAQRVQASRARLSVNSQFNRLSLPEVPAMAKLMVQLGVKAWQTQLTVAMGNAVERPGLLLQPYDLAELFVLLAWVKEELLEPGGVQLIPGNNIGYFGPYEEILRYGGSTGVHWGGCAAGSVGLGLEADGKVKGCPSLASDTFTGGNVRERSIAEIIRTAPELTELRKRSRKDLWGRCAQCYYAETCRGGCTWTAHSLTGRTGNNPYCIHRVLELHAAGKRERVVRVEPAPGLPFDRGRFEIIEETVPQFDGFPRVLGIDIADVLALRPESPGIWQRADLIRRIREHDSPSPKLPSSQQHKEHTHV